MTLCTVQTCERTREGGSSLYCQAHYNRSRFSGEPRADVPVRSRTRVNPEFCTQSGCERRFHARGLCMMHYKRFLKGGDLTLQPRRKNRRGHTWATPSGYVLTHEPCHPNAPASGNIMEHVVVMSGILERALAPGETVHHKNGVRDDNRPANLDLRVGAHAQGLSPAEALAWADEIIARYR